MSNTINPHGKSVREKDRAVDLSSFELGYVTSVPQQDGASWVVDVRTRRYPSGTTAEVYPTAHGSLYLPVVGTFVILQKHRDGKLFVVKAFHDVDSPVPDVEQGERHWGQPTTDAHLNMSQRGSIVAQSPAKIRDTHVTDQQHVDQVTYWELNKQGPARLVAENTANGTTAEVTANTNGSMLLETNGSQKGSVELQTDGTVVINGGGAQVLTDVKTVEDSDGHVTDIQLERSGSVLVPY